VVLRSIGDRVKVYTVLVSLLTLIRYKVSYPLFFSKFTLLFRYIYIQPSYSLTYYREDRATLVPDIIRYLSLPKKEDAPCWYENSIDSIKPWAKISHNPLGLGYHNPLPLRRPMSSLVNPNPGTSSLSHVCVSSVFICHAM
jgi:hypothetical protein